MTTRLSDMEVKTETFQAWIVQQDNDTFALFWSDYVANEWEETYENLSCALLRVAALQRCVEVDGFFTKPQSSFREAAIAFFKKVVTVH